MAATNQLLGPSQAAAAAEIPPGTISITATTGGGETADSLLSPTKNLTVDEVSNPQMGLTENLSTTYISTGNPCMDFFFHVVPDTPCDHLIQRLQMAWTHDPLTTLKLVCNLRGVRGTGKSDRRGFYISAFWMHKNHPKTLALNAKSFVDFGYFKDLPEILYRIVEGVEFMSCGVDEWETVSRSSWRKRRRIGDDVSEGSKTAKEGLSGKEKARELRKHREAVKARRASEVYKSDGNYRFLFDCVCDVFGELLRSDLACLERGELNKISLVAKWCPSIDSSNDKATLICEGIARRVFPRECCKEYEGTEEAQYVYKVRDRLRKQVLVPLRKALELPEVYMSANKWDALSYNRVASVAMKNYKKLFKKHDKDRFDEYLENVKSGKAKIAAGALLPHEIITSLKNEDGEDVDGGKVAELQWARMVEDLTKKGKLRNCIAVCDVSGSMCGTPMEVSVALGLLVSELSEEPWKGKVITFSEDPELHLIIGDTLYSKTQFVRRMDWGHNTNFQKVFDRILSVAVDGRLSEDQMIQRVFVFSDMEFDEASGCSYINHNDEVEGPRRWETDYEVIQRKYHENGFSRVPEIVFWNLRNSSSTPVAARQRGVALVSGFSKNLLTLFLEEGGVVNPEGIMALSIAGPEYQNLVVYD